MALRTIGFVLLAAGVASFFVGLFGIPREFSLHVSAGSIALLITGVTVVVFTLRPLRFKAPHISVVVVVIGAIALHSYENLIKSSGGSPIGFLLWSPTPYILCLIVAALSLSSIPAAAGAVTALLFDLGAYNSVFVNPTSSTAGLALLFVPLWNTLVFAPLAMLLAWLLLRLRLRVREIAP